MVFVAHCWLTDYVIDDAFITFRYARNLARGFGLVFNPGDYVEGYTNFLWTVLLGAVAWIAPHADLLPFAQGFGTLFGAATLVAVTRFSWSVRGGTTAAGLFAPAFLALQGPFVAWSTAGLETIFFTFLVFMATVSFVRAADADCGYAWPAALFALATMTRPDGVVFFGAASLHLLARQVRAGKAGGLRLLTWTLTFAAIFLPYFAWRWWYYGHLLPNTFYAKVGSGWNQYARGVRYSGRFLLDAGGPLLLLPLGLVLRWPQPLWVRVFAVQVAAQLAYVIYVGGDGLGFYRFFVSVLPFLALLAQEGALTLWQGIEDRSRFARTWPAGVIVGTALALAMAYGTRMTVPPNVLPRAYRWNEPQSELSFPSTGPPRYVWFDNYFVDRLAIAAHWLQTHASPGSLVAATPGGAIGYYMDLPLIDMLGLTDAHIARSPVAFHEQRRPGHERADGRYVLSRRPDFILLGNVAVLPRPLGDEDFPAKLTLAAERQIWDEADFHRDYERQTVRLADQGPFQYFTFYRRRGADGSAAAVR